MRRLTTFTTILTAALLAAAPALARQDRARGVQISVLQGKQQGSMVLKVSGASQRPLRVNVPWGVAYKLASAARRGGELCVSTAHDGMTGAMLRIVSRAGDETIILDRMRRAGPNGQTGSAALRYQRGVGKGASAFFIGRTRTTKVTRTFPPRIIGASGPSRSGAGPMDPYHLGTDLQHEAGPALHWYFRSTRSETSEIKAPLRPFLYNGAGKSGVTASPATLLDAANILGR